MLHRFALAVFLVALSAFALPPAFREVTPKIYRGDHPEGRDLGDLAERGIDKIVDLENDPALVRDEAERAAELGLNS